MSWSSWRDSVQSPATINRRALSPESRSEIAVHHSSPIATSVTRSRGATPSRPRRTARISVSPEGTAPASAMTRGRPERSSSSATGASRLAATLVTTSLQADSKSAIEAVSASSARSSSFWSGSKRWMMGIRSFVSGSHDYCRDRDGFRAQFTRRIGFRWTRRNNYASLLRRPGKRDSGSVQR